MHFSLVILTFCLQFLAAPIIAQVPYGNNPAAGHYAKVGDAKLYYEVYGKGQPILLLHGGVYGYIDEFAQFIERLSPHFQVICLATRGHGKSEMGHSPFTFRQRADDAFAIARQVTSDSVAVLGFSDGALSAYTLAANHPELVKRLIVIGAGDRSRDSTSITFNYNAKDLMNQYGDLFKARLKLMPEPQRWDECLAGLNDLYNNNRTGVEIFTKIKCPTLVMSGDRDEYITVSKVVKAKDAIRNSELSIIPGCGHVVFFCKFGIVWETIGSFLQPLVSTASISQ